MRLPEPVPGLVVCYSYLWADAHARGGEEGTKERPCAIVVARQVIAGTVTVTVAPITHAPPITPDEAVEIPPAIKRHLGLDDQRSWIVVAEVNSFPWPGPDLRAIPGSRPSRCDYGVLTPRFFRIVRDQLLALLATRRVAVVSRTQ
jgi:mRNA-degrading endonuclease toxin of MazEF toxin-antitoxin module